MLLSLKFPPGVLRGGTEYGSKGRYYDAYMVRWTEDGTLKPCGGTRLRNSGTSALTGSARAIQSWRDNSAVTWLQIGTHSKLYVSNRNGDAYDITPAGFTAGRASASAGGGYGSGTYGTGTYGTPRPDNTLILDATQWTMDTFGQNPFAVSPDDGKIYTWNLNVANVATQVTNSPTCAAVVITPERFVFALGTTDPRTVGWSDQQNSTVWTPSLTNQAGSFPLQTGGRLMCGKAVNKGTIILTDIDAWLARWIGGTFVYAFDKLGIGCGAISRQCIATIAGSNAVWMGRSSFWHYVDGSVTPLACDVLDYVFSNINPLQISKTYCVRDSANSEVCWYYCSNAASEIDTCVIWNYKFNYWNIGRIARTCGVDRGIFTYPILVDSTGLIYEHEVGFVYDVAPYAESGPFELSGAVNPALYTRGGDGERVLDVDWLIPDDKTLGDVNVTFKTKSEPDGSETTLGPYTLAQRTALRFEARQVKARFTGVNLADWRVGAPRLDVQMGGER